MNNEIQLSLYEMTKTERGEFVTRLVEKLDTGEADPLQVHKQVKCMEDLIKQITANENYRKHLLDEAGKYGKSFELNGAKYQVKEAGTKYDYSQCNDPELYAMQQQLDELTEKVKNRQKFLQLAPLEGIEVLEDQTGEVYRIYPPSKSSTSTLSITLS
jgi:hypothetical protein